MIVLCYGASQTFERKKTCPPPQSHKLKQSLTFSIGCSLQHLLSESRVKRVDLWMHTRTAAEVAVTVTAKCEYKDYHIRQLKQTFHFC